MGKFTGSLEKAGYDVGIDELAKLEPTNTAVEQNTDWGTLASPEPESSVSEKTPTPPEKPGIHQPAAQAQQPAKISPQKPKAAAPSQPAPSRTFSTKERSIQGRPGIWDQRLFKAVNDDIYLPEMFKIIRSRILNPGEGVPTPKTIMITSVIPREGKSFITANLGISLARGLDQHCLLVDCDLRRPSLAGLFGVNGGPGLADYLRDQTPLTELIGKTEVNKLSILPSGVPPVNPAELLSSARMQDLIEELSSRYQDRIILFDSPPMLIAAEASLLASQVDTVILVVRQGKAGKEQVQKLIETIGPSKILGVVFNDYDAGPFERNMVTGYGYYQGGQA